MTTTQNTPTKRRRRVNRAGLPMVAYLRVSTTGQAASGLGLDDQAAALTAWATGFGVQIAATHQDASTRAAGSAASRPGLQAALAEIREGRAAGLAASKIDRLGSGSDVVALAEEAKRDGWRLVVLDVGLDTATPAGMLVLGVLASVAAFERERIGERNAAWKHQARIRGTHRGAHAADRKIADRIIRMREKGDSYRAIAAALTAAGTSTARGGAWLPASVRSVEITRRREIAAQAGA
jgi:DNA invertase Pin-like site-specific DNA recombinase